MAALPGQLEPSLRLGRLPYSSLYGQKKVVRIRPHFWEDASVSLALKRSLTSYPGEEGDDSRAPCYLPSVHPRKARSDFGDRSSRRSNTPFGLRLMKLPDNVRIPQTSEEVIESEAYLSKLRQRSLRSGLPFSTRSQNLLPNYKLPLRTVARPIKKLQNARQKQWEPESQKNNLGPEDQLQLMAKCSRSMHSTRAKSVSSEAERLFNRMQQNLVIQHSARSNFREKDDASHISGTSARHLILRQGHATGVPNKLRELGSPINESSRLKVDSWLQDQ